MFVSFSKNKFNPQDFVVIINDFWGILKYAFEIDTCHKYGIKNPTKTKVNNYHHLYLIYI